MLIMIKVNNQFLETNESFVLKLQTKCGKCEDKINSLNSSIEELQKLLKGLNAELYALYDPLELYNQSLEYIESIERNESTMELYTDLNKACSDIKEKISGVHNTVEKYHDSITEKFAQIKSLQHEMSLYQRTLDVIKKKQNSINNQVPTFEEIDARGHRYNEASPTVRWFKSPLTEDELKTTCKKCGRGFTFARSTHIPEYGYDCHCICPD